MTWDYERTAREHKATRLRDVLTAAAITMALQDLEHFDAQDWQEAAEIASVRAPSSKTKKRVLQLLEERRDALIGVVRQPDDPFVGLH